MCISRIKHIESIFVDLLDLLPSLWFHEKYCGEIFAPVQVTFPAYYMKFHIFATAFQLVLFLWFNEFTFYCVFCFKINLPSVSLPFTNTVNTKPKPKPGKVFKFKNNNTTITVLNCLIFNL